MSKKIIQQKIALTSFLLLNPESIRFKLVDELDISFGNHNSSPPVYFVEATASLLRLIMKSL